MCSRRLAKRERTMQSVACLPSCGARIGLKVYLGRDQLSRYKRAVTEKLVISTDGAVSGRRATCAAVIAVDVRVIEVGACSLRDPHGYALAAETAGVALAGRLVGQVSGEGVP